MDLENNTQYIFKPDSDNKIDYIATEETDWTYDPSVTSKWYFGI